MLETTPIQHANEFEYATAADFCRIFSQDLNSLFLLALLLTGDHEKAEQCFVAALENATKRRTVFKEWVRPWVRRAIIQAAQCMVNPRPRHAAEVRTLPPDSSSKKAPPERIEIVAVLDLDAFDRFVFVMSVLEEYSYPECAILLGTTRSEVIEARTRALEQLGREVESRHGRDRVHAGAATLADEKPALELHVFATSA
jgi:DNA-directed RNA polymerase specialized sigma24 family protein